MKTIKLNSTLAAFLRYVNQRFYCVGDVVWSTKTDGSKRLTKTQFKSLEKKGLIELEWKEDHAVLKSYVKVVQIDSPSWPNRDFLVSYLVDS